jgi:hypothetical protein
MTNSSNERLWGLVLAGGDGTRLQALTRLLAGAPIPKQYCRIVGERSLLETTLARIRPVVAPEQTLVIVNRAHLDLARVARFTELLRQVRAADVAAPASIAGDTDALARADDLGWSDWGTPESIERTLATMGVVPPWCAPLRATA